MTDQNSTVEVNGLQITLIHGGGFRVGSVIKTHVFSVEVFDNHNHPNAYRLLWLMAKEVYEKHVSRIE